MADICIADGAEYVAQCLIVSICLLWRVLRDYKDALHLKEEGCKPHNTQAKCDDFSMMNMSEHA